MGADSLRIQELRRRLQTDPASIAFAQLAEEYRRASEPHEAIKICRQGLARYPGYHSARVTLGRALLALREIDEAKTEFEVVLEGAPDNLAAARGLDEIQKLKGEAPLIPASLSLSGARIRTAEVLFDLDALLEEIDERGRKVAESPPPTQPEVPSPTHQEVVPESAPYASSQSTSIAVPVTPINDRLLEELEMNLAAYEAGPTVQAQESKDDKALSQLESWLGAIAASREQRS